VTTPSALKALRGRLGGFGGKALGVLNAVGMVLDVYNYFTYEKPLMDQGWTGCTDPGTGLPKIPLSLCPPGGNGMPVA
jgi:hypothetical protein